MSFVYKKKRMIQFLLLMSFIFSFTFMNPSDKVNGQNQYISDYGIIENISLIGEPTSIDLMGNLAFISIKDQGIQVFDIHNPYNVFKVQNIPLTGNIKDLYIYGRYIFVAGDIAGFYILYLNDSGLVEQIFQTAAYGSIRDLCAEGDILYVLNDTSVLLFNITDIYNP
ncbi:MAG: hypothetical protein GF364_14280, partial [Candidatus Lokiarchaeota archaeon]|nr:hypothetical protein [Candidatus Lokiarchaeota archaeon]